MKDSQVRILIRTGILAVTYFVTARYGLLMDAVSGFATLVWPPTGISLAALLLGGLRLWPGIWLGAFSVNLYAGAPPLVACGIGAGNTLEALLGAYALAHVPGFRPALDRLRDSLALIVLAAVSTMVSATIGVFSLVAGDVVAPARYIETWRAWWLGDLIGGLVVAPLLLAWSAAPPPDLERKRLLEALALAGVLVAAGQLIFLGWIPLVPDAVRQPHLILLPLTWAAVRFGLRGATAGIFLTSVMAIWGTATTGSGPFVRPTLHDSLTYLQAYMAVMAVTVLVLGAVVSERVREIAARQKNERHLRTQYAAVQVLAGSTTLEDASRHILRAVCEGLGWELGIFWRVDRGAGVLRCLEVWQAPSAGFREFVARSWEMVFRSGEGLPGRIWQRDEPAWIPDVTRDANFRRAPYAARDALRAAFGFPIVLGGECLGVLEFFSRKVQDPDDEMLQALTSIGGQLGQFIQHIQAGQAVKESEQRMRAILDSALDAIITMDHRGEITGFNPAAETIFGIRSVDAVGQELATLIIPARFREAHRRGLAHYLATGEGPVLGKRIFFPALRSDGTEFPAEIAITRIDLEGAPVFTGHIRDITERVRAEEALERASRAREDLIAIVSHDLKNPLGAILLNVEVLLRSSAQPDRAEHDHKQLERIKHSAERMQGLIRDLLDSASIEAGRLSIEPRRMLVATLITDALEAVHPLADNKSLRLDSYIQVDLPEVFADSARLHQVFSNLLGNAIKFTPEGGTIALRAEADGTSVRFSVADTGPGIPPEDRHHLFDRFWQDRRTAQSGTGLGLFIAKGIVEAHGGRIWVESDEGAGSTFYFTVPASRDSEAPGRYTDGRQ